MMITMKSIAPKRDPWFLFLLGLYAAAVVLRFVLALFTAAFPTVNIDEFLYYSLARSIATEGKLLFQGQSADYCYLVYPLVLSPVYLLCKTGMPIFRILQVWNIVLMSTSVFPLFLLGRAVLKSEKKAFLFTGLSLLLPDFILGELILSEAILYPLFFMLMYCGYRYICKAELRCLLIIGLLGGLMYSTKPGAVVPAAVFILFILGRAIVRKSRKELLWAAASMLGFFATAVFFWALARFAFGYEGGLLSVYSSQVGRVEGWSFRSFLRSLFITPYYFILACGIIGFLYPLAAIFSWKPEDRLFYRLIIISLAVMILGTVLAIEQESGELNNIQLRYIAMYIPLMLLFCCLPPREVGGQTLAESQPRYPASVYVLLGFVILSSMLFGCKANAGSSGYPAQLSLSLLNDNVFPVSLEFWGNLAIIALSIFLFVVFYRRCRLETLRRASVLAVTGCMLINTILGYTSVVKVYNPYAERAGRAVYKLTADRPYLQLISSELIADYGVDANTTQNNCIVYSNGFLNCLQRNNGCYVPYIPDLKRGMRSVTETPDVDTLVLYYDIYPFLQFSKSVSVSSPFDLGNVYIVRFTPGERLIDSAISNLSDGNLYVGYPGIIHLFSDEYLQNPLIVRLEIESPVAQTMTVNTPHELHSVELSAGKAWYEVSFEATTIGFNFQTEDESIKVYSFDLEPIAAPVC